MTLKRGYVCILHFLTITVDVRKITLYFDMNCKFTLSIVNMHLIASYLR